MTLPAHYQPDAIGTQMQPDIAAAAAAGAAAGLSAAADDAHKTLLLLVDIQIDFVHADGALSIPGAIDDTRRTVEWIYRNAGRISHITATLDTHLPIQVFHPLWWVDADGQHPAPFTAINAADVAAGKWRPLVEPEWSAQYVEILEEQAKKQLMIWPFHVLRGTPGQALVPALSEAIAYHTAARGVQPEYVVKGLIPGSEHYSAIEPEVKVPGHPQGDVDQALLDRMAAYDTIYVAGQARSHCVMETVASMVRHYPPEVVQKMRVLEDTMSSVAHPEIDFDTMAREQFARFAEHGLTLTSTTAE